MRKTAPGMWAPCTGCDDVIPCRGFQGYPARILETRKTAPGMRVLDKWAVLVGGGVNHRVGLYDMVMIKNNHIAAAGGVQAAIRCCQVRLAPVLRPPAFLLCVSVSTWWAGQAHGAGASTHPAPWEACLPERAP